MKKQYKPTRLRRIFNISDIYTVHYFEYEKNYAFKGESHDFWEIVYVDKGEIEIDMGDEKHVLSQGHAVFHQPNEYHNLRANGIVAPNLVIISFSCKSPAMDFFRKRILPISDIEKHLLATIVKEATRSFSSPLDNTFLEKLERRKEESLGSEQMISLSLEHLLISLHRNFDGIRRISSTLKQGPDQDLLGNVLSFLQENICEKLTFSDITKAANTSPTTLKTLFKEQVGEGVMTHFTKMKFAVAKTMIREGNYNISQIASHLGFDTIHLFSRRFKQIEGMSPTEYGRSVKVVFEEDTQSFLSK
ncbi:MAG: AraC family transcriptional regulator [Clostridia bacterium]|nr:AraC family transcriptional regulator [Clostridia bacterium]